MPQHPDVRLSEQELEDLIAADLPVFDLTTHLLGIADQPGSLVYLTRQETVVCASEEAARIMAKLGLSTETVVPSGECLAPGMPILIASGPMGAIHQAWRLVGALLEHASGIATRTWRLVRAARAVAPNIAVLTTRKFFPGTKRLSIKAILAGGALPHRLGLSETVLVFAEHIAVAGGLAAFLADLPELKLAAGGKPVGLEAHTRDEALAAARAGADVVQVDKFTPEQADRLVREIKRECPGCRVYLAGGINADNAAAYAASGADALVTTWPYFGKPADIKALIAPADEG
ncbi:MAG: ModD protein [Pseudomonadota bacterium]